MKSFSKSRVIRRESFSEFEIALGTPHGRHERLTKFLKLLNLVIEVSKVLTAGNKWRLVPALGKTARIQIRERPLKEVMPTLRLGPGLSHLPACVKSY